MVTNKNWGNRTESFVIKRGQLSWPTISSQGTNADRMTLKLKIVLALASITFIYAQTLIVIFRATHNGKLK